MLFVLQGKAEFDCIHALALICDIEGKKPDAVLAGVQYIVRNMAWGTFLEILSLKNHRAEIPYVVSTWRYLLGCNRELVKRLTEGKPHLRTDICHQLYVFENSRRREKDLDSILRTCELLIKAFAPQQKIVEKLGMPFGEHRQIKRTIDKQKNITDSKLDYTIALLEEIDKNQTDAELMSGSLDNLTLSKISNTIPDRVPGWTEYCLKRMKEAIEERVKILSPCFETEDVRKLTGSAFRKMSLLVEKKQENETERNLSRVPFFERVNSLPPTDLLPLIAPLDFGDKKTSETKEVDLSSPDETKKWFDGKKEIYDWAVNEPSLEESEKDGKDVQEPDDPLREKENTDAIKTLLKEILSETKITGDHDKHVEAYLFYLEGTHTLKEIEAKFNLDTKKFYRIRQAIEQSPKLAKHPRIKKIIETRRIIEPHEEIKLIKDKILICPKCNLIHIPGTYNEEFPYCSECVEIKLVLIPKKLNLTTGI
ncbi:MAG TPA: hypothetical protein VMW78_09980 [Anaerolineae bacterium]|nr:hypothetical protein [Anaerolineae bacterium]